MQRSSVKEERVSYRESHKIEHLVSAGGNVRVRDDAGAAGRLHLEAFLHGGKRHVSAGSPEDAGDDDRLHLLRAHGDGHENLRRNRRRGKLNQPRGAVSERVANGGDQIDLLLWTGRRRDGRCGGGQRRRDGRCGGGGKRGAPGRPRQGARWWWWSNGGVKRAVL